jgi:hypothetical protein
MPRRAPWVAGLSRLEGADHGSGLLSRKLANSSLPQASGRACEPTAENAVGANLTPARGVCPAVCDCQHTTATSDIRMGPRRVTGRTRRVVPSSQKIERRSGVHLLTVLRIWCRHWARPAGWTAEPGPRTAPTLHPDPARTGPGDRC